MNTLRRPADAARSLATGDELAVIPLEEHGPIDPNDMEAVKKDPYSLPPSFIWADVNLDDDAEAAELYTLLHENYVEDGDQARRGRARERED